MYTLSNEVAQHLGLDLYTDILSKKNNNQEPLIAAVTSIKTYLLISQLWNKNYWSSNTGT